MKIKIAIVILLSFAGLGLRAQNNTCTSNLILGISFPPVTDSAQRAFAKKHLDILGVKKIRFAEDWALREPNQGIFNWKPLDERIDWAHSNNYEILLTIQSNAPSWACSSVRNKQSCVFNDNNDFKIYIDSLLKRYSGKISKIQFGNEWQSDYWYIGNAENFIIANNVLYNSVQAYAPSTKVVLGGFTTISLRFLAGCNGTISSFRDDDGKYYDAAYLNTNCTKPTIQNSVNRIDSVLKFAQYDMLDLHFYDDVEQWGEYYKNFSDTIVKPIIVSEFGGPNMKYESYSESYQANRLYQYIRKLDSLQIPEAYFFKLVEGGTANPAHLNSGLIDDSTLTEKQAYHLFKSFTGCLTSVNDLNNEKTIRFYPNPMQNYAVIEFKNKIKHPAHLIVYNNSGNIVRNIHILNTDYVVIERQVLSSGLYYITIKNDTGVVKFGKLIIQ